MQWGFRDALLRQIQAKISHPRPRHFSPTPYGPGYECHGHWAEIRSKRGAPGTPTVLSRPESPPEYDKEGFMVALVSGRV